MPPAKPSPAFLAAVALGFLPLPIHAGVDFEREIAPILEMYCVGCHDADTNEGEIEFDRFLTTAAAEKQPDLWEKAAVLIKMGEMPPRDKKKQPTDEERKSLIAWAHELGEKWDSGEMGRNPGRTTIRRLNKYQYNYTIRDLFGLNIRPAKNFPEDGGGEAGFDNNADALFLPSLLENYVEAAGDIVSAVYVDPAARARYLFIRPNKATSPTEAARKILTYWSSRAYRRRAEKDEVDRLLRIFQIEFSKKKNFATAMAKPLVSILISPNFLYRAEQELDRNKPFPVDPFDLATRLSYFLWSSTPDEELLRLAAKDALHEPAVLHAQVVRMVEDGRSYSLAKHFAGQWFGWELLRSDANPDEKRYPEFTFQLRLDLYFESSKYFQHLINTNGSAYDLLHSNYTFLNDRLARHYGIPGVGGSEFRKVILTNPHRGGVLGMGSVLTTTSLPLRSSPAKRGAFVLDNLLGIPPPEPPMNVAQLPDDDREIEAKTFRDALVQHREDINCRACHEILDPIGFGLESFDAIGRWRTEQNGIPLDTAGEMPDGTKFTAPADLKKSLLTPDNKALFARNFVEKLLSFALGRELTPYDRPEIRKITDAVVADNGSIQTAILGVVKSYPFRYRNNDPTVSAPSPEGPQPPQTKAERKITLSEIRRDSAPSLRNPL